MGKRPAELMEAERLFDYFYGKKVWPIPIKRAANYESRGSGNTDTVNLTPRQLSALTVVLLYSHQPMRSGVEFSQQFCDHAGLSYALEDGCADDMIKSNLVEDRGGNWGSKMLRLTFFGEENLQRFLDRE